MTKLRVLLFFAGMFFIGSTLVGQDAKKEGAAKVKGQLPQGWGKIGLTDDQKQKVYKIDAKYDEEIDKLTAQIKELKDKNEEGTTRSVDRRAEEATGRQHQEVSRHGQGQVELRRSQAARAACFSSQEPFAVGIERTIDAGSTGAFSWPTLVTKLTALGEKPVLRMIDGLPAFPDETPADDWQELRLGLSGGMITVRRKPRGFACVTWGTADPALQRSWDRLCWALADTASGTIVEEAVEESAADFARRIRLA